MGVTSIQWTDRSVNPIRARLGTAVGHHCVKVSPGCANCYASKMQSRFRMPPFEVGKRRDVVPFFDPARLKEVLSRRIPTKWFWCDMSDMFGEWVPDEWIDRCFAVMALTPWHTHQVLTKRPERILKYFQPIGGTTRASWVFAAMAHQLNVSRLAFPQWPLPNVWLGISAENQETADERIPLLLQTPAAVHFISAEPLLGPIDLTGEEGEWLNVHPMPDFDEDNAAYIGKHEDRAARCSVCEGQTVLDWVIIGGESGPNARPCDLAWIRGIVEQCKAAEVPCFTKQLGARPFSAIDQISHRGNTAPMPDGFYHFLNDSKGGDPREWPGDLRVRQFPCQAVPA